MRMGLTPIYTDKEDHKVEFFALRHNSLAIDRNGDVHIFHEDYIYPLDAVV